MIWEDVSQSIRDGDFLLALFQAILALVATIVNVILYPVSLLVKSLIPELDIALQHFAQIFEYAGTYIAFVIDSIAFPALALTLIASYYLFAFTSTFAVWGVKLMVKWKKAIW